ECIEAINKYKPDLIFLDIQMPEMDGFEVLNHLGNDIPIIIFVTAFDEYAVKAFEVQALDYLLKPFDRKRFNLALERVFKTYNKTYEKDFEKKINSLLKYVNANEINFPKRFIIKQSGKISFVPVDEIDYLEATGNYIKLSTSNGSYLMRETMNSIEKKLDPEKFIRIQRSFIIKTEKIKELKPYFNGEYIIVLKNGKEFKSSKTYKKTINTLLLKV
ncbi:MAG TPA: LytTR family DNA-binding domain-containing protein, partial [Ignavibacteriaceae bacterium]|nr:LytTR family DNA-binding domain-containing protein [Ignavibacteriaceae bacterium]